MIYNSKTAASKEYWCFIGKLPRKITLVTYASYIGATILNIDGIEEYFYVNMILADSREELIQNLIDSNNTVIGHLEEEVDRLEKLK